jgi:predicted HTH transcriptional regulator
MGVMAGRAALSGAFADVSDKDHRESFQELRADARTGLDYIRAYREGTPPQRVREMIKVGETATQEFKSTLRWNQRTRKHDDQITHACIKTIAAFLNTEGGHLLIGVSDDGGFVGIDQDGFDNPDKFQLHLWNVLKQSLGSTAATFVRSEILAVAGLAICVVTCAKSDVRVYCRLKNGEEHFYVRTGPATTPLPVSETVAYIAKHFGTIASHREEHQ